MAMTRYISNEDVEMFQFMLSHFWANFPWNDDFVIAGGYYDPNNPNAETMDISKVDPERLKNARRHLLHIFDTRPNEWEQFMLPEMW